MRARFPWTICLAAVTLAISSCTTSSQVVGMPGVDAGPESDAGTLDAGTLDAGVVPIQEQRVSACGGFQSSSRQDPLPPGDGGGDAADAGSAGYCDREVLAWTYDADAGGMLELTDRRVVLNCCGDHRIGIVPTGPAQYRAIETDAPKEGRCNCMCVFDFELRAGPIAPSEQGTIDLDLQLDVTDVGAGPRSTWRGSLDLTQGGGEVVVSEDPAPMNCGP